MRAGKLLYFGVDGPISSIRADNLRDSMEDMELLRMLDHVATPAEVNALTSPVAEDTYSFSRRSDVLYRARDAAARLIEKRTKTGRKWAQQRPESAPKWVDN
jgi:hypothetical protein